MLMEKYNSAQVREVLEGIGIKIHHYSTTDFFCYCPFHNNSNTPAFAISRTTGAYICYNPSCDARGGLDDLIIQKGNMGQFEALRFLRLLQKNRPDTFDQDLESLFEEKPDFVEFSQEILDGLHDGLNDESKSYFHGRGINDESIDYFYLGYSQKQGMVTVPLHSPTGMPVGIIGRSIEGKRFKNSDNLPRSLTMFNIHRAKKVSPTIIVCESSFDAIRIHQAGYPNVVATLGGGISKQNIHNLNKYSSSIIIATDADEAGRKLGMEIVGKLPGKSISWACYEEAMIYPHEAKDVGDLTDQEIKQCIKNAISHFEYIN